MKRIVGLMVMLLIGYGISAAAVGNGQQSTSAGPAIQPSAPAPGTAGHSVGTPGVDASSVILPCTPVAAYWMGPPQSQGMPPGPELAVVSIDVRPKDARLYLDDRFVGRARYLDGSPGYLYLTPGEFHLELRLGGYETVAVDLTAEAGCRFDIKHRLFRVKGAPKGNESETYGKGKPFNRVFSPQATVDESTATAAAGPDPALRPDLGAAAPPGGTKAPSRAALKLSVRPATASISIDGGFVATARELDRMEGPLAVSVGSHHIEVSAPGHQTVSRNLELKEGELVEISIELPASAGQ